MTDRKRFTRRDNLKTIAAAGTVLGGTTLGVSTAMAHDEDDEDGKDEDSKDDGKGDDGKKNKDGKKGSDEDREEHEGKEDGKDDERKDNAKGKKDNGGKKEKDGKGRDGKKKDGEKNDGKDGGKKKGHGKKGDGKEGKDGKKKADGKGANVAEKIELIPVCYKRDGKKGDRAEPRGKFRIENHSKKDADVGWERHCDGKRDYMTVAGGKSEHFWIGLGESGTATMSLYYDGKKIAAADAKTDSDCDD